MHSSTLLLGLAILTGSVTFAADQVVSMYIPGNDDGQPLAGKIVGSDSNRTSYSVTCADSVTTTCNVDSGVTIIQAPSTVTVLVTETGHTGSVLCTHNAKTGTCSLGMDGEFFATSTEPVLSYEVTITETETGSPSTSKSPVSSALATPTTLGSCDATEDADATSGTDAQETDGPDNGAISGQPFGAAAVAMVIGVSAAMFCL
ncbi:predicted protein [Aspergillus nidulans FGSC A4]|uniref:GPI anchored protein n=1 Tax=Emericella nidulans (strain FGSC A4 / ATCC 38163 / CBS 112.46 / NRRL 194 / M139) TaxID=227321 RepID=Q5B7S6_EMENI|nr:hypothetical protein [Aspergillus nidulans FGSC A4]EAA63372.1 predicted protein [Aspergillus nidulans FGSC A4]CBF82775.1 TPA: conserved hypothetical protein [Aspergillus nidulans FGSC A4]|eukprot:XP_661008.1 predicted protein [Aspergillus nidulans FGSC A4]